MRQAKAKYTNERGGGNGDITHMSIVPLLPEYKKQPPPIHEHLRVMQLRQVRIRIPPPSSECWTNSHSFTPQKLDHAGWKCFYFIFMYRNELSFFFLENCITHTISARCRISPSTRTTCYKKTFLPQCGNRQRCQKRGLTNIPMP